MLVYFCRLIKKIKLNTDGFCCDPGNVPIEIKNLFWYGVLARRKEITFTIKM